jgi:ABC-type dipeptide/oligopeptide/nickel transport system ATPase component
MSDALALQVDGLSVTHAGSTGGVTVVRDVSFSLPRGRILGIAGESGCGKTQLLLALLGLSPQGARISGSALLAGQQLVGADRRLLRRLRGNRIAMVFQDPMTALNPYLTIGTQLAEVLQVHRGASKAQALAQSQQMLEAVGIDAAARRLTQYPHELSGGMRQRVLLAMALLCEPDVLLADEPTTALDVTVQAQILDLLLDLRERLGMAVVLVTHDMGVLAQVADDVAVMQAGQLVEQGSVQQLFDAPHAAATVSLLTAARQLSPASVVLP